MPTLTGPVIPRPSQGVAGHSGELVYYARLVTTTSGALDATVNTGTLAPAGGSVAKTATKVGRYTFSLGLGYRRLLAVNVTPIGPTDAIYGAATLGGPSYFVRNDNVSAAKFLTGSTDVGTFDLQFVRTDTNADAELPDGTAVMVQIVVDRGF